MKLRKSTTPIMVINADTRPIKSTAMKGTRKRFRRAKPSGQSLSRLRVKASRVALSMEEFTEVRVATKPAIAIIITPPRGMNFAMASVRAVSEPASCCHGTVPKVTAIVTE